MAQKWFKYLFGESGDKTAVPDVTDPSGYVSYQSGYPVDYERVLGTDPLAKAIERQKLNQVLYDVTSGLQQYQTHGFPEYIDATANGGTAYAYAVGAVVKFTDGKNYQNTVAANTNAPNVSGWTLIEKLAPLASPSFTGTVKIENANVSAYGKNYLINGGLDYWNYATSQTTNGYGSDDRWANVNIGSTKTHSRLGFGIGSVFSDGSLCPVYYSSTVVTSVAGAGNAVNKTQRIENVTKLAGRTVTVSFWAKADSAKNIAVDIGQVFGTGGSPSVTVQGISAQKIALTSAWQKKTITVSIPSINGKSIGTDGISSTYTILRFWFDAGSDFNTYTDSLGQQSGTFDIAEVKLEEGSVATPWTPYEGEFGGEVQACQRYYEVVPFINWAYSAGVTTGVAGALVKFTTTKRVAPTAGTITVLASTGTNTYSIDSIGTSAARLTYNSTQSGTVGASGSVPMSAEL